MVQCDIPKPYCIEYSEADSKFVGVNGPVLVALDDILGEMSRQYGSHFIDALDTTDEGIEFHFDDRRLVINERHITEINGAMDTIGFVCRFVKPMTWTVNDLIHFLKTGIRANVHLTESPSEMQVPPLFSYPNQSPAIYQNLMSFLSETEGDDQVYNMHWSRNISNELSLTITWSITGDIELRPAALDDSDSNAT